MCIAWFYKNTNFFIEGFQSMLQMHVVLGLLMKGAPPQEHMELVRDDYIM